MLWISLAALALVAPTHALIRFGCSQLVVERLDPLVQPGANPSSHVHQIIGGNSFRPNMSFPEHDLAGLSTCTTCQPADDFSNYWTANLYFRSADGTYSRVRHKPNVGFDGQQGGMTVYYMQNGLADFQQQARVRAFAPGFRMIVGNPTATTLAEANRYPQVTYTCLQDINTRFPETKALPTERCPAGIMVNVRFPTCWDGVNLDSPNHMSHVAYPSSGTFDSQGPCPSSHPIRLPQILYETIFATEDYANQWPSNGQQPFVWSYGDTVGYGNHGDYVFGWRGDALQRIMDEPCYVTCSSMRTQAMSAMNQCRVSDVVGEEINTVRVLPGQGPPPTGGTSIPPGTTTVVPPSSTSRPPTQTTPSTGNCAARWGQCGGQGWTGANCCQSGSTCQAQNQWYSQCL